MSLQENIDTSSSGGRLVFHIFASLAEFERDLIRGRTGGRPPLLRGDKLRTARKLYEQKDMTVAQIGEVLAWIRRWSFGDRLISAAGTTKIFGQE